MKTANFNFSPFIAFAIGVLIAIAFILCMYSCGEPEPQPQPIDWELVNDSAEKALEDSLSALDSVPPQSTNVATQMTIESNFDKIN